MGRDEGRSAGHREGSVGREDSPRQNPPRQDPARQNPVRQDPVRQPATGGTAAQPPDIASIFATAVRNHQSGALSEADRLYRHVLALEPSHVQALFYLGIIQMQFGLPNVTVELIEQAIALSGDNPEHHYNIAYAYQVLGRNADAVTHYRKAIALRPEYAEAHMNLGNALKEQGKLPEATDCYKRVIGLRPDAAVAYYNLANVLAATGHADDAFAHYRRALALKPDFAPAHNNFGNALLAAGKLDEASAQFERALALDPKLLEGYVSRGNLLRERGESAAAAEQYRHALALRPDYADAHNNLGTLLLAQGNPDGAEEHYRHALRARPDLAEAHNNLGIVLAAEGKLDEAIACYRQGIALRPDFVAAYENLARALVAQGHAGQALAMLVRVIEVSDAQDSKTLFVQSARGAAPGPELGNLRHAVERALTEHWGRPSDLAGIAVSLIKADIAIADCILQLGTQPVPSPAETWIAAPETAALSRNSLVRSLLACVPVADIALERLLTMTRRRLLETVANDGPLDDDALGFACVLAEQCCINEYVFAATKDEMSQARRLRDNVITALSLEGSIAASRLVAVACYFSLAALPGGPELLDRTWPEPVAALVARQIGEAEQEASLAEAIPLLATVDDAVSQQVQQQYEENPYPRWMHVAPAGKPMPIDRHLRAKFPLAYFHALGKRTLDLLIAGCGTGQHAIETTRQFVGAKTLAVDLSRTSLAYAARKTRELGLTNIEYVQADILELGAIGRRFDAIEASGVLHHMADPMAAWRVLVDLLHPGGFMVLGFYSEMARRDVVTVRRFIAERGLSASADDIRRVRQELMGWMDGTPMKNVTASVDFYSMSGCRDLLFHAQEHHLNLPTIDAFLAENDLEFLGFEVDPSVLARYRQKFPHDKPMTDLALWHEFESENRRTFAGMYQFWVQKRP
jgi:tetratricopeptide (TPR) repeat protein/ubiquinone/menaquinone biosynthesis C-methylase UbiE